MPYLYNAFEEAARTGMPVARSLAIDYSFHPEVYDPRFHNQYLFGPSILVAPSESGKDLLKVWFPPGSWSHLLTGETYAGGQIHIIEQTMDKLPVFVKAGAVLPAQALVQHLGQSSGDTLILHVYAGGDPTTTQHYEDDGESLAHAEGDFCRRDIVHTPATRELVLGAVEGPFVSPFTRLRVILHGAGAVQVRVNGAASAHKAQAHRWLEPISHFDPFSTSGPLYEEADLAVVELPFSREVITFTY
jgi:alpha-glucosidase